MLSSIHSGKNFKLLLCYFKKDINTSPKFSTTFCFYLEEKMEKMFLVDWRYFRIMYPYLEVRYSLKSSVLFGYSRMYLLLNSRFEHS